MPRQAPKATNIAAAGETPLTFAEEPPRMPRKVVFLRFCCSDAHVAVLFTWSQAEVVIDRSARGTKRGRASRVISSDEESYEVAAMKRPKASRPVPDEEGVNDDANVAVEIEGDADEGFPIVHSSRRSGMTARPSSTRVRHQSSKAAAAAAASNSPLSDDDASASRPGTSPPPSPKLATKPTRKKVPPKRRSKKETDSESEFDDPDVVPEADLSGLEDVPAPSAASSKSKTRGLVLSGKGRGGTGKKKAAEPNVAVRDESSSGKRAPASVMPPAKRPHAEDDTASPVEQGATEQPLAKKSRLPPIPKKSNIANGTASAGSNTPTNKPNTATAAVLPAGVRRPPPVPGAKKGGDIDLNNLDEYNKLFGIVGSSSVCFFDCKVYPRLT